MKSPRILFLTDSFLPHCGGARVYYYHLLQQLAQTGLADITVSTKKVAGWKEFDQRESRPGFKIVRCGRPLRTWKIHQLPKILLPLLRAALLLASRKCDLIHFGDLYPQGVLSLWFKRLLGTPYVAYCHGEEITQTDGRRYQPRVRNAIFREAAVVVAANEFARRNLLRIGIAAKRIRKITPGVDCSHFQPQRPNPNLIRKHELQGKFILLTVARLVPRKGHATVLAALRDLLQENPEIVYVIVGTGPEELKLREVTKEWKLDASVRFAGFVDQAELPDYYSLCDIFVMPNSEDRGDIEGFGMVFLEANACCKSVIGARSGGAEEAILHGETGLLVTPDDPNDLANALRLLIKDPDLRLKLGLQGLARARTQFTWDLQARILDDINREILQQIHPHENWRLPCISDAECTPQQPT